MKICIISGQLGGRLIASPPGNRTHPMSERMRGALFNTLGDIDNQTVLDAFSGSGAIAIEAISRGASHVTAVDNQQKAYQTIKKNIDKLQIYDRIRPIKAPLNTWLINNNEKFNIIICDPPYDKLQHSTVVKLSNIVKTNGVFVLSWPTDVNLPEVPHKKIVQQKSYGDSQLVFYKSNL